MMEIEEIKQLFKADKEHSDKWRKQAREDFDFVSGEGQWTNEERSFLERQNRPPIVFNRTATIINSVAGSEIRNREEVRYFPVEEGDARPDELLTDFAKWFRNKSDGEAADSDAFWDTLVCGMGWTETTLDYEANPDGDPDMQHIDPLEMYWDASARKRCLTDARRVWRAKKMPLSEAKDMFPDASNDELHASWANVDALVQDVPDVDRPNRYDGEGSDEGDVSDLIHEVVLIHLQIRHRVDMIRIPNPSGEDIWMSEEEYETVVSRAKELAAKGEPVEIPNGLKQKKSVWKQYWIGSVILDEQDLPTDNFTYQCITGYRDHNSGTWHGLLHYMRDPQKWANKWLSQILHLVNSAAKGGVIAQKGAFESPAQFEQSWSKSDQVTWVEDFNAVKEKPVQKVPGQLFTMMEFAINSIRDVSGVNLEMLGQRGAIQAASLEQERKDSSQTILSTLFDSLRLYRKRHGAVMLELIKKYLNDGRLVRVAGETNAQYVPLAINQSLKYDIFIDESPQSPHMKEKVWAFVSPILPQLPPQIAAQLLEYAPIPMSIAEKIKQSLMQLSQPDPMQQAAQQAEVQKQFADIEMTESAAASKRAEAQKNMSEATKNAADVNLRIADTAINLVNGAQNG